MIVAYVLAILVSANDAIPLAQFSDRSACIAFKQLLTPFAQNVSDCVEININES